MKTTFIKIYTLSVILTCQTSFSYSQKLSVTNQKIKTEEGFETDAWSAHLDQDVNACQKTFEEFIEKTFSLKTVKRTKQIYAVDKQRFSEISALRLDVRAVFENESGGSMVSFIFSPGYDVYLSNSAYTEDFIKAENFVKNYVKFHYTTFYNKLIADLGSKIKENENEIKSNDNKISKYKSSIADNDTKINSGDPNGAKLKEKNTKYYKDIADKEAENGSLHKSTLKLQDEIIQANESLKKVNEYK